MAYLDTHGLHTFWDKIKSDIMSPIGAITPFAGATAPDNWLICDGSEVVKDDYLELYDVIGDLYGTPSDSEHFVLPNLKGKSIFGLDSDDSYFNVLGKNGGVKNYTPDGTIGGTALTVNQIPSHTHSFSATTGSNSARHNKTASGSTYSSYATYGGTGGSKTFSHSHSVSGTTGGLSDAGQSHTHSWTGTSGSVLNPYLTLNYIIRVH